MTSDVRITQPVARILREFLSDVSRPRYGYDLMQATGLGSGKLYPILARLHHAGWLTRGPEEVAPSRAAAPRYVYRLSEDGAQRAAKELAKLSAQVRVGPQLRLRPQAEGGWA
jgi:PadR family transcriptional regulator, regulatory protein PadR